MSKILVGADGKPRCAWSASAPEFDAYHDKVRQHGKVVKIASGYGTIRPNLYGSIKNEE